MGSSNLIWGLLSSMLLTLAAGQATFTSVNSADGLAGLATSSASPTVRTTTINGTPTEVRAKFTVPADADTGASLLPNVNDPNAIDVQTVCPGYRASNVQLNANGLTATLALAGTACNVYGTDVDILNLNVEYQTTDRLAINISPAVLDSSNTSWYILPEELVPRPAVAQHDNISQQTDLEFKWNNEPTFSFSVSRRSTGDIIYNTEGSVLVYENQFIEFVSQLPENYNLYGLGERIHGYRLGNNFTATIFAADAGDPIDYNIYGSHPFYLDTRYFEVDDQTGNLTLLASDEAATSDAEYVSYSHGVFLRNAHPQEVVLKRECITWRTLGGSIDLFFFDGPAPDAVTRNYQVGAVGLPAMQSYWTFGYHQCRWGYANWTQLEEVVDTFAEFDIPLETIWTDIDYMDQYRDFTTDNVAFPVAEGQRFLEKLHSNGQHYIPIIDAAIYHPNPENASDAYATFDRGNSSDVFLRNPDGSLYIGAVWPGYTVFPDWQAAEAVSWWVNECATWHKDIPFDGIWIDMSEVSSFCVGSCGSGNVTLNPAHPPFALPGEPGNVIYDYPEFFSLTNATEAASASAASSSQVASTSSTSSTSATYLRTTPTPGIRDINHPPYVINNINGDLAVHAVSPNATHITGTSEYDVHNLYGHQLLNATYQALLNIFPSKRPFIIGRSTFAGSGKWAGHWGGDNASKWFYMYFSIPQALSFSLFGFPMFGPDTCGFNGNTDAELCSRWMQLSAFFPFYRNHNTLSADSQEPYRWAGVAQASRDAMYIRYSLLPYMYTLFHRASTTGSTVMRALAFEFPNDPSLANADRQFLLGPAVLLTPVLTPNMSTVNGVFPSYSAASESNGRGNRAYGSRFASKREIWYDWYTGVREQVESGENKTLQAPLGHIPVHVRGGAVLPLQEPGYTTTESRKNPWSLLVALDVNGNAKGELYLDDGESLEPETTKEVRFVVEKGELRVSSEGEYVDENKLANVTVYGVQSWNGRAEFEGRSVVEYATYNETSKVLKLQGLEKGNFTAGGAWSEDWRLTWS